MNTNIIKNIKEEESVNVQIFKLMEYSIYLKESFGLIVSNSDDQPIEIITNEKGFGMVFILSFENIRLNMWNDIDGTKFKIEFCNVDINFVSDVVKFTDKWFVDNKMEITEA